MRLRLQPAQQGHSEAGKCRRRVLQSFARKWPAERLGEPARGRHGGLRGRHEGEEFEQVVGGDRGGAEPPPGGWAVDEQRRAEGAEARHRFRPCEGQHLAIGREQSGYAGARHQSGPFRQGDTAGFLGRTHTATFIDRSIRAS
jgi:hypothetical protein